MPLLPFAFIVIMRHLFVDLIEPSGDVNADPLPDKVASDAESKNMVAPTFDIFMSTFNKSNSMKRKNYLNAKLKSKRMSLGKQTFGLSLL